MADGTLLLAMIVGYKISVLLVGLALASMGFRLFLADKVAAAGDLKGGFGKYSLSLRGGAPGVFFCMFGTILIGLSVFKGISYDDLKRGRHAQSVEVVIPDAPPN